MGKTPQHHGRVFDLSPSRLRRPLVSHCPILHKQERQYCTIVGNDAQAGDRRQYYTTALPPPQHRVSFQQQSCLCWEDVWLGGVFQCMTCVNFCATCRPPPTTAPSNAPLV